MASYIRGDKVHLSGSSGRAPIDGEAGVSRAHLGSGPDALVVPLVARRNQTEPCRFRFKIRGHGISDVTTVYILLGE